MVRAPTVDKMGLKKGPWTLEEDQMLITYIQSHGHGNWRALPKQAGLLRCGKSCRLRWVNYLRPDIKRGNFSIEEEEIIIKLYELIGSRWSAIATKLPGRTDNEIKNMWHTKIKKRLKWHHPPQESKSRYTETSVCSSNTETYFISMNNNLTNTNLKNSDDAALSPLLSSSDFSSTTTNSSVVTSENAIMELYKNYLSLSPENYYELEDFTITVPDPQLQLVSSPVNLGDHLYFYDDTDFWINVLNEQGGLPKLLEI